MTDVGREKLFFQVIFACVATAFTCPSRGNLSAEVTQTYLGLIDGSTYKRWIKLD